MINLYILTHLRIDNEKKITDEKQIGIYTDKKNANIVVQSLKNKPGFKSLQNNFKIIEIKIDDIYWADGFDINKWIYFN